MILKKIKFQSSSPDLYRAKCLIKKDNVVGIKIIYQKFDPFYFCVHVLLLTATTNF